jgi:hypothetical protein
MGLHGLPLLALVKPAERLLWKLARALTLVDQATCAQV